MIMDKEQARAIVKNTFENPFDKGKFTAFTKNLLNHVEEATFSHRGYVIPDAFEQNISSFERIGKYTDGENRIDIIVVRLKKETSIERARSLQRNFVAGYLNGKYGSSSVKEAALVAFVSPNNEDWRFSLVKMDYRFEEGKDGKVKVKEEFTPARRWSFLVGANENSHTAKSRLVPIIADVDHNPTLEELEEAFNIEKATKEFFGKYRDLFLETKKELDNVVSKYDKVKAHFKDKGVNTVDFAKKLLGQIIFLYFLQKKGWFGVQRDSDWGTGSKHFLRELFEGKHGEYNNFFNDILEPLFFEALRIDRSYDDDYYSRFNCKIPFLNGGLFDPISNYDWVHTDILLPNELFSNSSKTKEGDTGNGILDVFDRYNFTVKEDEPLEKEVAIDPELLGKAYEKFNAIRPDNYEEYKKALKSEKKGEEHKFNRQYGVYYTPREIVHYMCQQSLICWLHSELNQLSTSYEKIGEQQTDLIGNQVKKGQLGLIVKHTSRKEISKEDIETFIEFCEQVSENEATVLAKGRETDTYYYKLPESIRLNAKLIDDKLANIKVCDPAVGSGAFPVGMMSEIVKARNVLSVYLASADKEARTPYHFKRECIEKSLYGVDIDPGAVEIAKLRLWLSLVVDEEDIKKIKPLPNLDYKIVCGNSLLGYPYEPKGLENIESLKEQFINEVRPKEKIELRNQIDHAIYELYKNTEKRLGYKVTFDFRINFSEVFRKKDGFDVVIGNPPYGLLNKKQNKSIGHIVSKEEAVQYKKIVDYKPAWGGMVNVFRLFIVKSINIIKPRGFFSEIFPFAFTGDISASELRKWILNNYQILRLEAFPERDNEKTRVFDSVKMSVCILNMIKETTNNEFFIRIHWDRYVDEFNERAFINKDDVALMDNDHFSIPLIRERDLRLIKRIYSISKKLSSIAHCFTGEIDLTLGNKYLSDNRNHSTLIKGAIIDRFLIRKKMSQGEIKYLNSKLYLKENQGVKSSHYQTQRIVMQGITGINEKIRLKMTIIDSGIFCANSVNYLVFENDKVDLKYYLALFNSSLLNYIFKLNSTNSNVNGYEIDNLPMITPENLIQQHISALVDRILAITKDEDYLQNPEKQAKVKALEREIDQLVYKLYGLTEEEISIVENFAGTK